MTNGIPSADQMETQYRIGKDSIDKEREKATEVTTLFPLKLTFGEFENVKLTQAELDKLNKRWKPEQVASSIEDLSIYLKNTKKKYNSHYATLLNWLKKDFPENQQAEKPKRKGVQEI